MFGGLKSILSNFHVFALALFQFFFVLLFFVFLLFCRGHAFNSFTLKTILFTAGFSLLISFSCSFLLYNSCFNLFSRLFAFSSNSSWIPNSGNLINHMKDHLQKLESRFSFLITRVSWNLDNNFHEERTVVILSLIRNMKLLKYSWTTMLHQDLTDLNINQLVSNLIVFR